MHQEKRSPYSFSNPRYGSLSPSSIHAVADTINDTENPNLLSSNTANIAYSMHNLTLSPTASSNTHSPYPLTSTSSPISGLWSLSPPVSSGKTELDLSKDHASQLPSPPDSARSIGDNDRSNEWKTGFPSLMGK